MSTSASPKLPSTKDTIAKTHPVDLALPKDKKPTDLASFSFSQPRTVETIVGPRPKGGNAGPPYGGAKARSSYAIGSSVSNERVYFQEDTGLFQCVYEAWKNHWNLKTSPDDWWFTVVRLIAKAIDKAAKSGNKQVRELFVDHEGKKHIAVGVDVFTIYQVDYDAFFSEVASQIEKKIKVPEYASAMRNDFSTSSTSHLIASEINLMASMQEFFSYEMMLCGCGIKGLEMLGTQQDWDMLTQKLSDLKTVLEPILPHLYSLGGTDWFNHVEFVFQKLAQTYAAKDETSMREVADFWADVFMVGDGWKYGPSGFGGHKADAFNGWLVQFLTGSRSILKENFFGSSYKDQLGGLNTVPMKVTLAYEKPPISDDAELVAGIMGFQLHQDTFNGVPSLQPHHMWAMKLPNDSPLRRGHP